MKFVTYQLNKEVRLGVITSSNDAILDLRSIAPQEAIFSSMQSLIESGQDGLEKARAILSNEDIYQSIPLSSIQLLAPIQPKRILGTMFMNPDNHLTTASENIITLIGQQTTQDVSILSEQLHKMIDRIKNSKEALYELRDHTYISHTGETIHAPQGTKGLDYELELGCVIGKTGKDIAIADAADYIFGYTIFNDWTLRDLQIKNVLSGKGWADNAKDFDQSVTLGPCIVTKDEIDINACAMKAYVNKQLWSEGNTNEHVQSFEEILVSISKGRTIHAGEVWSSGTVGTGCGIELGKQLQHGDLVELEIQGIGTIVNTVHISE